MIWSAFWDTYLGHAGCSWRTATRRHAVTAGRLVHGSIELDGIDQLWACKLSRAIQLRHRRQTAASYARRLQAGFTWGVQTDLCPPVRLTVPAVRPEAKGNPVRERQFSTMLQAASRYPGLPHILKGLWTSGLRVSELLALEYNGQTWSVCVGPAGRVYLQIPALQKNGRRDFLPCPPEFSELVSPLRTGRVFPSDFTSLTVARQIIRCGGSAHDLRRSFALRWAERGLAEAELARLMRHRHPSTTRQYYLVVEAERLAERMEDLRHASRFRQGPVDAQRVRQVG